MSFPSAAGDGIDAWPEPSARFDGTKSNVNLSYVVALIHACQAVGEQQKAQALINELMSVVIASPSLTYHDFAIHRASLYALSGQVGAAIETLEEWVKQGSASTILRQHTRFELSVLADNPRNQELLQTINNRLSEQRANLARWEANGEMTPMPREVSFPGS